MEQKTLNSFFKEITKGGPITEALNKFWEKLDGIKLDERLKDRIVKSIYWKSKEKKCLSFENF